VQGKKVQKASRDLVIDDLYKAHRAAVLRVCSGILRNADDAADATQEVFLIALESLDPAAKNGTARAWLLTVARNHCLDLLRRRKRLGKALTTLGPDDGPKTDMETAVADRDFVDIVFKQLSRRERQALWQSAVESRPLADIASGLRLSYMAAAQVLHRARRHAVQAATRVAVVFGIFQLGRQRSGVGPLGVAQRIAAVAAVPLIVVSMNASSAIPQAASGTAALPAVSAAGPAPSVGGSIGTLPGQAVPNPSSVVPGSAGVLKSAETTVDQLVSKLRSVAPSPAPLPPLPTPTAIPTLP
jgi:RNA polymerase sigma-70 factor (ECF subfamily)